MSAQEETTNNIEYEETFGPTVDFPEIAWTPVVKSCEKKNPFHHPQKTSFPDFNSPSVFRIQATPVASSKPFQWSVEEMAILRPADIDELPDQEVVDNSYFITPRRAQASTKFFSGKNNIPVLMTPWTVSRLANKTNVNSTLKLETPNPYCFSRPPEMLEQTNIHTPICPKSLICPSKATTEHSPVHTNTTIPAVNTETTEPIVSTDALAPSSSLVSAIHDQKGSGVDKGIQTMLTLPLDFDLERQLSRSVFYQGEEMANTPSIRRILFRSSTPSIAPQPVPPVESVCSPVVSARPPLLHSNSPSMRANSFIVHSNSPIVRLRSNKKRNYSLPQQLNTDSESLLDPQETPRTTKHLNNLKSRGRPSLSKRHPVGSFDISSSPYAQGSFLMSLMSEKLECSNTDAAFIDMPCVSPIAPLADTDVKMEELENLEKFSPPQHPFDSENSPPQPLRSIAVSPITSCMPKSPGPFKTTSTPFCHLEPKTPPSSNVPFSVMPQSEPQSPPSPLKEGFSNSCHNENVMPEDPAPMMTDVPDKLQATHSLECDSGIDSSYWEQSSILQTQNKNRTKQKGGGHQLSNKYSQEEQSKTQQQIPSNNSISKEHMNKLRVKRSCFKLDSSPLAIVHHARSPYNSQESKRYQRDSSGVDSFNTPFSPNIDFSNFDSGLSNSGVVQQQAKQIETIEKLRNFNKWSNHKKNIEMRTKDSCNLVNSQTVSQNLSSPPPSI